jgi:hypothetical protein
VETGLHIGRGSADVFARVEVSWRFFVALMITEVSAGNEFDRFG